MLAFIVPTTGRQSETYIASHIDGVLPSRTVVCCNSATERPAWTPHCEVMELERPTRRLTRIGRRLLTNHPALGVRFDLARTALWLRKHGVKVVFCEYLQTAISVIDVCTRLQIPVIAHAHGFDVSAQPRQAGWTEAYRKWLPRTSDIVVVSPLMKQQVTEFGLPPERVHVIPCGTAVEPRLTTSHLEKREYTAIVVGRLVPKKGIIFVLESFRRLLDSVPAHLLVVGDGPMGESARQYVEAAGIGTRVKFLGELPNDRVRQLLRTADVLLQHSVTAENGDTEGVPVSILEAMAEGIPVVATRHAGIPHAVADGITGFLVEPTDCREMSRRTAEILTNRPLRESMGIAAHKRVLQHFSLQGELSALRNVVARHGLA